MWKVVSVCGGIDKTITIIIKLEIDIFYAEEF